MASKSQLIKDALKDIEWGIQNELAETKIENNEVIKYIIKDWIDSLTDDELRGLNDKFTDLDYPRKDEFEALFS
tara:strand:- start:334 stop:555 length:222 start_codon:yes stop_codon:yes gene_type:complete